VKESERYRERGLRQVLKERESVGKGKMKDRE
jgi:hypothetical protein